MASERILIVEDNPINIELAVDLLEVAGYVVWRARTAREGIELASTKSPDLVLIDIGLPDMDGLSATRILKESTSTKNIPVVALTAQAMRGDKEKMLTSGCDGYISKPINTREFAKTVAGFIRRGDA